MKKKFKLFASIASISMTLALMVFGIWAATSVNVTISSNVSYTAEGVAFNLYGKSEALASQPTGTITALTEETADQTLTVDVTNAGSGNMTLPDRDFSTTNTWVVYTFTIENIGSNVIGQVIVDATCAHDNIALTQDDTSSITLNNGETASFRVYLHLTNENQTITGQPVEIEISLAEPVTYAFVCQLPTEGYSPEEEAMGAPSTSVTYTVNGQDVSQNANVNVKAGDIIYYSLYSGGRVLGGTEVAVTRYNSGGTSQGVLAQATIEQGGMRGEEVSISYTVPEEGFNEGDYLVLHVVFGQ